MATREKPKKALIRVDASDLIGHGHVMRCLTLAQQLADEGWVCTFVCRDHKGHLGNRIRMEGHQLALLPANTTIQPSLKDYNGWCGESPEVDAHQTLEAVSHELFDWLILDHYELDEKWEKTLRKISQKTFVIDDLANRQHDCDILLDQTPDRQKKDYINLIPAHCRLLLGPRYALLRKEFARVRIQAMKRRWDNPVSSLLLSLGGTDPENLTLSVLQELEHSALTDRFNITVLPGTIAAHRTSAIRFAASSRHNVNVLESTNTMADLMTKADLAIGAAGGSSWERAALGLPTILLQTAENQSKVFETMVDSRCVAGIKDVSHICKALSNMQSCYRAYSIRSAFLVDGDGTERISNILEEKIPEYTLSMRPVVSNDEMSLARFLSANRNISEPSNLLKYLLSSQCICLVVESGEEICGAVALACDTGKLQAHYLYDQTGKPLEAEIFMYIQLEKLFSDTVKFYVSGDITSHTGFSRYLPVREAAVENQTFRIDQG